MTTPEYERDSDRAVGRLLSGRDGLSRPEHEAIFASVLGQTQDAAESEAAPAWWTRWWWVGVVALAAVALAAVLMPTSPVEPDDAFTPRGVEDGAQVELDCGGACHLGGRVLLTFSNASSFSHVAAFAFREDGAVVWFAPASADAQSVALPDVARGLLPFQVEVDDTLPPGAHAVVVVFSTKPMTRTQVEQAYESRPDGVEFVERTLVVEASR